MIRKQRSISKSCAHLEANARGEPEVFKGTHSRAPDGHISVCLLLRLLLLCRITPSYAVTCSHDKFKSDAHYVTDEYACSILSGKVYVMFGWLTKMTHFPASNVRLFPLCSSQSIVNAMHRERREREEKRWSFVFRCVLFVHPQPRRRT